MSKSNIMTGVAIASSMIGSSMILLPVTFSQHGVVVNMLFCVLMCALMGLTCKLLVDNLESDQVDISQSIKRRLGPAFGNTFAILSSISMVLVSSIFFLLASDLFYGAFVEVFGDVALGEKGFKLILMVLFALLNFLPDLKYVFKAVPIGMGALVLATATLIVSIAFNTENISWKIFQVKQMPASQLLSVACVNSYSFMCHPSVSPIVKENKNQKENQKAVYYGYLICLALYLTVGTLGSMAVYGKIPPMQKSSYNIIDYFSGQFQAPVIGFLNFVYLFIVSPILPYVGKVQVLQLIPQKQKEKMPRIWTILTVIFAAIWIPCNTMFILFETSPVLVINFVTSILAFYVMYFLPVVMTLKAGDYVIKKVARRKEQAEKSDENDLECNLVNPVNQKEQEEDNTGSTNEEVTSQLKNKEGRQKIPIWQKVFYGGVILYGLLMLVLELISFFT